MAEARPFRLKGIEGDTHVWALARLALASGALAPALLILGWRQPVAPPALLHAAQAAFVALYALSLFLASRFSGDAAREFARRHAGEIASAALGLLFIWWAPMLGAATLALFVVSALEAYGRLLRSAVPAGLTFVATFVALILTGALLLMLPAATPADQPINFVDSLFTSSSAVCVTGHTVRDTGTGFTRLGQSIILVLIQTGGLGIVFFAALVALSMGGGLDVRSGRALTESGAPAQTAVRAGRLVAFIGLFTLIAESAGALALYFGLPETWPGAPPMPHAGDRFFHCAFHSVSALCNAGFSTFGGGLQGLRFHWTTHVVIVGLNTLGGLGFPVLYNISRVSRARARGRRVRDGALVRFTLHTRLALTISALLYVAGLVLCAAGRMLQENEGWRAAILDAHFMSVTARTAGFDTVAPATLGPLEQFTLIVLMFVGGSPGSFAGGVKTVVVGVLLYTVWSTAAGRSSTHSFRRTISDEAVRLSATLATAGLITVALVTGALAATEGARPDCPPLAHLLFESVSACSTVGLSTGAPADFSDPGKLVLTAAMFLGRVGPLAAIAALVAIRGARRVQFEYASERVILS